MSPDTPIDRDVPCIGCSYNLRGLTIVHRCPECESPALRSYLLAISGGEPWRRLPNGVLILDMRKVRITLSGLLGCHPNAIRFVATCIVQASKASGTPSDGPPAMTARALRDMIRALALAHFGDASRARAGLEELGLARSEDVGRIVAALVESGLVTAAEGESPSDFHGMFTTASLFPETADWGHEGMKNRATRARIAQETVGITGAGEYTAASGRRVSIRDQVEAAVALTRLYRPGELPHNRSLAAGDRATTFETTGETTLAAARRLVRSGSYGHVAALNFASARNPGGGFLGGSLAQEESLAASSALYPCIAPQVEYYAANNARKDGFYTDHLIFSPGVPLFRNDEFELLDEPYLVSIITAPAVNAGIVLGRDGGSPERVVEVMRRRTNIVLNAAATNEVDCLVLGAWGCGVFKNDPQTVASIFADALLGDGPFAGAFAHVCFAVLDRTPDGAAGQPFRELFG